MPDKFSVKIEGDGVRFEEVERVLGTLRAGGFWRDPEGGKKLHSLVPAYRLSKFQEVPPASASLTAAVVAVHLRRGASSDHEECSFYLLE